MSDKSPKKNSQKTAAKTLKEKRADKKNKSDAKERRDTITEIKR